MTPEEFQHAWEALQAKLTDDERALVDTVITGAEVNYSVAYMLFAALLGGIGGWCLAQLWN